MYDLLTAAIPLGATALAVGFVRAHHRVTVHMRRHTRNPYLSPWES